MVASAHLIREVWESGYLAGWTAGVRARRAVPRRRRGLAEIIDISTLLPWQRTGAGDGARIEESQ